ncbi:probable glycosyltransferase At5g03795 isoform X2 [Punica granatum]|uniref:Probable glycosyltransferase At5g03795 isoform X2 n=1 Tax=Punica granatum TaxID=22663 RepID=A0A6P8BS99_PUNGR|nr:probable glycosyltransferase At5g03795 isoform X2 [Punica granatum]
MDHKYQSIFKVETRKLLWLLAMSLAVVLLVQFIELPHGNVLSLLFSASRAPFGGDRVALNIGESLTSAAGVLDNATLTSDLNSTSVPSVEEMSVDRHYFEGNGSVMSNETLSESGTGSDLSSEADDYSIENFTLAHEIVTVDKVNQSSGAYATEEDEVPDAMLNPSQSIDTFDSNSSSSKENSHLPSEHRDSKTNDSPSIVHRLTPTSSPQNLTSLTTVDSNTASHLVSPVFNTSTVGKEPASDSLKDENLRGDLSHSAERSGSGATRREERPQTPTPAVITISEMNRLLDESRWAYRSMKPRWSSAADQELVRAKLKILSAPIVTDDPALYAPLYRNVSIFKRVYVYKEGEKPVLHQPVLKGIYASEGWFMKQMKASKRFVTKDARKAHLFYLPFSSRMLEEALYVPGSHNHRNLIQFLKNYLDLIGAKYPFWNRTGGADHFLVACHDWAPAETRRIMARCIRALCNSDVKEGFVFGKDVSLPETFIRNPQRPLRELGGKPPSKRSILTFFAGNMHGYLRPLLLQHWGNNRDPNMRIFGQLPKVKGTMNYAQHMKSSKYCICAKGYEVNSPRVVEAIFYECIPVIISDNFIPPFFEMLNWESFAVFVLEKDIPNLKKILLSIPEKRYREMHMRVKKVQQHFLWHPRPVKYDIFHMILHSVWYNRVLHINPR